MSRSPLLQPCAWNIDEHEMSIITTSIPSENQRNGGFKVPVKSKSRFFGLLAWGCSTLKLSVSGETMTTFTFRKYIHSKSTVFLYLPWKGGRSHSIGPALTSCFGGNYVNTSNHAVCFKALHGDFPIMSLNWRWHRSDTQDTKTNKQTKKTKPKQWNGYQREKNPQWILSDPATNTICNVNRIDFIIDL